MDSYLSQICQKIACFVDGKPQRAYPHAERGVHIMRKLRVALMGGVLLLSFALVGPSALAQSKPAQPEPTVKVGDMAPDFTLTDQNGKQISLRSFRGKKNVALAFYIFAFTGG